MVDQLGGVRLRDLDDAIYHGGLVSRGFVDSLGLQGEKHTIIQVLPRFVVVVTRRPHVRGFGFEAAVEGHGLVVDNPVCRGYFVKTKKSVSRGVGLIDPESDRSQRTEERIGYTDVVGALSCREEPYNIAEQTNPQGYR